MSTGRPVVTTGIAIQGIRAIPGEDLISADDPQSFARAVIELLNDAERMKTIGVRAREFVMADHSWKENFVSLLYYDPDKSLKKIKPSGKLLKSRSRQNTRGENCLNHDFKGE